MLRLIKHQITNNKFLISQLDFISEIIRKKSSSLGSCILNGIFYVG